VTRTSPKVSFVAVALLPFVLTLAACTDPDGPAASSSSDPSPHVPVPVPALNLPPAAPAPHDGLPTVVWAFIVAGALGLAALLARAAASALHRRGGSAAAG